MLTTLWNRATHSRSSSPAPTPSSTETAAAQNASGSAPSATPFTDFVLARIPDEETQKLFALSFGEYLKRDPDALEIDFDVVFRWLGYDRKDNAVRLLKREIPEGEYALLTSEEGTGPANRASYLISFNQFEELMIGAQTIQGKKARRFVLFLKRVLQEYLVAEQEAHVQQMVEVATAHEAARANALQIQLDGLRAQQQHLYCFKLFGNRYKCGIGVDVDRRIRQHKTTCPSGYLVCSVPITCKAMEKLFESVMKEHGAWIRMEEYELAGDESEIKSIFAVFARTEELLNTTPLDQCDALRSLLDTALGTSAIVQPDTPVQPTTAPATPSADRTSANDIARPRVSPQTDAEQTEPQGPLPDLSKDQLRSFIRSHCVRGGDCSVGTVRFRCALAVHFPGASCKAGPITKMMTEEGFMVGTARPTGGKHTSSFKGIGLSSP